MGEYVYIRFEWQHFALRPVTLLSEGLCPLHNIELRYTQNNWPPYRKRNLPDLPVCTYCPICDAEWKLTSYETLGNQYFLITANHVNEEGKVEHEGMTATLESLRPPPFPGNK